MLSDSIADSDFDAILGHLEKKKEHREDIPQIPCAQKEAHEPRMRKVVLSHIPVLSRNPPQASENVVYTMREDNPRDAVLVEEQGKPRLTKGHLLASMLKHKAKQADLETRKRVVFEKALSLTINRMRTQGVSEDYIRDNFGAIEIRVREELGL